MKNGRVVTFSSCEQYLEKSGIAQLLRREEVTDLYINRPGEIFVETLNGKQRIKSEQLSFRVLEGLAIALCVANGLEIMNSCIHSVIFPGGERGQIVLPPAIEHGCVGFAIRKVKELNLDLEQWYRSGRLDHVTNISNIEKLNTYNRKLTTKDYIILQQFEQKLVDLISANTAQALKEAMPLIVKYKLNVIMVGATGSGKTTFSKILAQMIPRSERIITIEDVHELSLPDHEDKLHLLYKEGVISAKDLLFACMRLKPSRILITEIRSSVAWYYLTALNTGHPGGITSVHANNSANDVFNRIATLAKESEIARNLDFNFLLNTAKATVDVILFFEKTYLKQIFYNPYLTQLAKRGLL